MDFVDATDDPARGSQQGCIFRGYHNPYCIPLLYVFCHYRLLTAYLCPGNSDAAIYAWAMSVLLMKCLRQDWPKAEIQFRGDSGFYRRLLLFWCYSNGVNYIISNVQNAVTILLPNGHRPKSHSRRIRPTVWAFWKNACIPAPTNLDSDSNDRNSNKSESLSSVIAQRLV